MLTQIKVVRSGFKFECCHSLEENYFGKCSNLHGHSYKMTVAVKGDIDNLTGFVIDFAKLKDIVNEIIISKVDHTNLNESMREHFSLRGNTTCENMIIAFWWALDHIISETYSNLTLDEISLWETENNYCVLSRKDVYGG
jgi:6-pyruvoyltetrahydropterin/6-carboxytetrahydropterin synthase